MSLFKEEEEVEVVVDKPASIDNLASSKELLAPDGKL